MEIPVVGGSVGLAHGCARLESASSCVWQSGAGVPILVGWDAVGSEVVTCRRKTSGLGLRGVTIRRRMEW